MVVSGVRITVLSGREGMCGGQEAGGRRDKILRFHNVSEKRSKLTILLFLIPVVDASYL